MAVSDSEIVYSQVDGTATVLDGAGNSLVLAFVQSDITWTEETPPYTEARVRNKHASSTPILRKTGDGNVTGTMRLLISTFYGSAAVSPREAITFADGASGWTSTSRGDKKTFTLRLDLTAAAGGGAVQRVSFNYCVATNLKFDPKGADGLMSLDFDITDHENAPTYT